MTLISKAMPAIDGMIAATGIANDLIIITRNTSDMEISGASLLDLNVMIRGVYF